jgi:hypothetical protein
MILSGGGARRILVLRAEIVWRVDGNAFGAELGVDVGAAGDADPGEDDSFAGDGDEADLGYLGVKDELEAFGSR